MSDPQVASYEKILIRTEFELIRLSALAAGEDRWSAVGGVMVALDLVHLGRQALPGGDIQPADPERVDPVTLPPPDPAGWRDERPHPQAAKLLRDALGQLLSLLEDAAAAESQSEIDAALPAVLMVDRARRVVSDSADLGRGGDRSEPPAPTPPASDD